VCVCVCVCVYCASVGKQKSLIIFFLFSFSKVRKKVYFEFFLSINTQLMLTSKCYISGFHSNVFDGWDLLGLENIHRSFGGNYCFCIQGRDGTIVKYFHTST